MSSLPDQAARLQALHPQQSFIVQAPAGSGKTELLSLRYLNLLSTCADPEEILAITFTRKAASEMKDRIIRTMRKASSAAQPEAFDSPLELQRHRIARAALAQNARQNWEILDNPSRLRIQTIDSFCLNLATKIPLLSRLGGSPNVSDDVAASFDDAIANTLQALNADSELADDIAVLLAHLDNDIGRVEKLLHGLLHNRDQWLPYVVNVQHGSGIDRQYLQDALNELVSESLLRVYEQLAGHEAELAALLEHAIAHLQEERGSGSVDALPVGRLPPCTPTGLSRWRLVVNILLTLKGEWRAKIDKRQGFPAEIPGDKEQTATCKLRKQQWRDLVDSLSGDEELRQSLSYLVLLPEPELEDRQWDFLTALSRILTHLSSQLLLSFRRLGQVDHAQVAAAAYSALGDDENPTDLALSLDYRLQHIMVDEFQDTSKLQMDLLEKLTAGWQAGDGRTLFLVGDAMQSVYGFRDANVGIYLKVRESGLGQIPLEALTLQSNFRSQARLVDWVNDTFAEAFPARADQSTGAVPFTASVASKPALADHGVTLYLTSHEVEQSELARQTEAAGVVARVLELKAADPDASLAILVRSRGHLQELVPALRAAAISWQATDIDRLQSLPVIEDLQCLTRAIINLGDRIAWLAILRAPWCGLSLADLLVIARDADQRCIWTILTDYQENRALSADARDRLSDFVRVLDYGLRLHKRAGLRQVVEAIWTLCGGGALALTATEQASVARYLDLLQHYERGQSLRDFNDFASRVAAAFTPSVPVTDGHHAVHILTMHKAKGLEFDHVILPCLGARPRGTDKALLQWHERVNRHGDIRLYLAALSPTGSDDDPLYRLLRFEQERKSRFENVRLLYIATTRARKSITLSATLERNARGEVAPFKGSLLDYIWPQLQRTTAGNESGLVETLEDRLLAAGSQLLAEPAGDESTPGTSIRRFDQPLRLTPEDSALIEGFGQCPVDGAGDDTGTRQQEPAADDPGSSGETEPAATIGTLIHEGLDVLTTSPATLDDSTTLEGLREYRGLRLRQVITGEDAVSEALAFIEESLASCRTSPQCAWLFNNALAASATELPVSRWHGGQLYQFVVDRTFIDSTGTRWIIDYKTAAPTAGVAEADFLDRQCRHYRPQLENYRRAFTEMESRPVKIALLFTAIPRLVELT